MHLAPPPIPGYATLNEIGRGTVGPLYSALHTATRRIVGIRFLDPSIFEFLEARRSILKNWRAAAPLDHPGIIRIHEIHETPDGAWMIHELVEAEALDERFHRTGTMPADEVSRMMCAAAAALAYAWSLGVPHGIIKPANIMIEEALPERVRIDYASASPAAPLPIGNPRYMSPELIQALPVTERSDLFSLGMVAHEALTGRVPFDDRAGMEHLVAKVTMNPTPVAELAPQAPPVLAAAIDRCIRPKPEDRWDLKDLVAALS